MTNLAFLKKKPTKIVAVGLNYKDHAREMKMALPKVPLIFMKPVSALIGPKETIQIPKMSKRVEHEAELACIVKNEIKNLQPEYVMKNLEGFTCLNDVTARDLQKLDGQWTRAKSFDTFCPIGPKIVKDINPNKLKVECLLNDKIVQSSNTKNFIFKIEKLISFISKIMTLEPGDIVTTGTPAGIGPMKNGDKVEVRIEGIGTLENFVR
ncbi:fumarylacetoacetate hydrolase family protein [Candidatus Woesearchaeota archaeon]|nr:fumarylacetoacetate hydrolase family protein [Candidatus Woesearchaeota archaeon]